jgi:hypothetical protein
VNMEIAVSTSIKLVDSDGNLNWDIDAPDDHARQLADQSVNRIFKFRSIKSAMPQRHGCVSARGRLPRFEIEAGFGRFRGGQRR